MRGPGPTVSGLVRRLKRKNEAKGQVFGNWKICVRWVEPRVSPTTMALKNDSRRCSREKRSQTAISIGFVFPTQSMPPPLVFVAERSRRVRLDPSGTGPTTSGDVPVSRRSRSPGRLLVFRSMVGNDHGRAGRADHGRSGRDRLGAGPAADRPGGLGRPVRADPREAQGALGRIGRIDPGRRRRCRTARGPRTCCLGGGRAVRQARRALALRGLDHAQAAPPHDPGGVRRGHPCQPHDRLPGERPRSAR